MGNSRSKVESPEETPPTIVPTSPVTGYIQSPVRISPVSPSRTSLNDQSTTKASPVPPHSFAGHQQSSEVSAGLHRSSSSTIRQSVRSVGKSAVQAKQNTKHCVDNDYIFPKCEGKISNQVGDINVPYRRIVDKFGLRVCPQYNSKNGCHAVICRRFHVCLSWVNGRCQRDVCYYDHDFVSRHNESLETTLFLRRGFSTKESLAENHRRKRRRQTEDVSLCLASITNKCTRPDCLYLHAKAPYLWQVKINDSWSPFSRKQNVFLEEWYSRPGTDEVELPSLENYLRTHPAFRKLHFLLCKGSVWLADFEAMNINCGNENRQIRRLSTPSDVSSDHPLATRWIWYWLDEHGRWHPYTDGDGEKFFIIALSDQIENCIDGKLEVKMNNFQYCLDKLSMSQQNKETGTKRKMRRRPCFISTQKREMSFTDWFSKLPENKKFVRQQVMPSTAEFVHVKGLLQAGMPGMGILSVERIQNDHLWKAYQNKKQLLLSLYGNRLAMVNEQYMFHGTRHSVIDLICGENFDWRLFGSNVGNVYGKGTYFTNTSSVSNSYAESSSGVKAVFIAFVLVGTLTVGNREMEIPPQNPDCGRRFDTSCNKPVDPEIFVKYNKDEYYPAYIITYTDY